MYKFDMDFFVCVVEYFNVCEKIVKEYKCCKICMCSFDGKKEIDMFFVFFVEERKKFIFGFDVKQELKEFESVLNDVKVISIDFDIWE